MYKKWLILAGCFFGGILLCGLGAGIQFMEFSGFTYAGDREQGKIVEETLTYYTEEDADFYYICAYSNNQGKRNIISDDSLPEDRIEIDVKYNDDYEKPFLSSYVYDIEPENNLYEDEYNVSEYSVSENGLNKPEQTADKETEAQITVELPVDNVKLFMKYKDVILADIKNGQIGTYYDYNYGYLDMTVRCHPSMMEKIKVVNW